MRFLFCAAVISYIINDWSGVDVDRAVDFVRKSHVSRHTMFCNTETTTDHSSSSSSSSVLLASPQSYDFGIAQAPGQEAHGLLFCLF